jgi:hypothetical protein
MIGGVPFVPWVLDCDGAATDGVSGEFKKIPFATIVIIAAKVMMSVSPTARFNHMLSSFS